MHERDLHPASRIDDATFARYLRAHLAASDAAEGVARALEDGAGDDERRFLERFLAEIQGERSFVEAALAQLSNAEPPTLERVLDLGREAARWVTPFLQPGDRLQGFEALAVGVWGKRLLWGTVRTITDIDDRFGAIPLDHLMRQAERQEHELLRWRQRGVAAALLEPSAQGS